jgi:hypothetical protein
MAGTRVTVSLGASKGHDVTEVPVTTDMHVRYYRRPRSGPYEPTRTSYTRAGALTGPSG